MIRLIRFIGTLVLALLAVAITFGVLIFFIPTWQMPVVERVLEADTERQWQVGTVSLTPGRIAAGEVFILDNGMGLEIKSLEIRGPFWKAPFQRVLQVDGGEIDGLFLDLSQLQIGDTTSRDWQSFLERMEEDPDFWNERFAHVLHKIGDTGLDAVIKDLDLKGQVLLPGQRMVPVRFSIVHADSRDPSSLELLPLGAEQERML